MSTPSSYDIQYQYTWLSRADILKCISHDKEAQLNSKPSAVENHKSSDIDSTSLLSMILRGQLSLNDLVKHVAGLERQVEIWKAAAQQLAELNRYHLDIASRNYMATDRGPIKMWQKTSEANQAYDRAMKVIK